MVTRRGSMFAVRCAVVALISVSVPRLAASGPHSASPRGSSEFYETLDAESLDDADEVVGSDGTLTESSPDIHDILELIEDGRVYPVLSKEESQYTPTSVGKEYSATPDIRNDIDASSTQFVDYEDDKKRSKRNFITKNEGNNKNTSNDNLIQGINEINDTRPTTKEEASAVQNRTKREAADTLNKPSKEKRVKTGDTILNIRGAVKDSIGDASAGRNSGTSMVGTVVIHPSQYLKDAPDPSNHTEETPKEGDSSAGLSNSPGHRQVLAEHRSKVRLHCDLPANISVTEWVKDGETQVVAAGASEGRPVWWAEGRSGALVVGRTGRGEAGEWRCGGYAETGERVLGEPLHLTVYEESRPPYLELDGRRLDPGNTWVPVREGVVLEVLCIAEGGVPAPELTWRLVSSLPGVTGGTELRRHLRTTSANYTHNGLSSSVAKVTVTRALHNATLECDATQPRPEPRHPRTVTARLQIHVTYPPSFVITRWPGFGVALWTGGRAALRCDADSNPPVRAWWVRESPSGDAPSSSPPPVDAPDAEPHTATLSWGALTLAHAGWYRCRAKWNDQEYSSIGYFLRVQPASEKPATATSSEAPPATQNVEVPLGGTVQVHCPKGSVGCWSRKVLGANGTEAWAPAGSARAHGVLGIRGALHQEGGEYRCVGTRAEDDQRLRELKRVTLTVVGGATATAVGASVLPRGGWTLTCAACGRGRRVRWIVDDLIDGGAVITPGQVTPYARAHQLEADAASPSCSVARLELASAGEVWCAVSAPGGGAVAVFPSRAPHHVPRALATAAAARLRTPYALALLLWYHVT